MDAQLGNCNGALRIRNATRKGQEMGQELASVNDLCQLPRTVILRREILLSCCTEKLVDVACQKARPGGIPRLITPGNESIPGYKYLRT